MKFRWIALTAVTLVAGACARGGEADRDAALMDTTSTVEIIGDTAALPPVPVDSADPMMHDGHMMDSAGHTAPTQADSVAHP